MNFTGDVALGKLDANTRQCIADYIATFDGTRIDVKVRKHRAQRSLDQNAYLHAEPFLKLSRAWGESVERTKLICMGEFWGWEPVTVGAVRVFLPVKAHTSDMTVPECTAFIDWLLPWALQDHGVAIDLPEDHTEAA